MSNDLGMTPLESAIEKIKQSHDRGHHARLNHEEESALLEALENRPVFKVLLPKGEYSQEQLVEHCKDDKVWKIPEALQPKQTWIDVKDRLPEHLEQVLTYSPETELIFETFRIVSFSSKFPIYVTHWMPLPPAPDTINQRSGS